MYCKQSSFSTLWDGFSNDKTALAARNRKLRELRKAGHRCRGFSLPGQMRKYAGLGQPDGRSCTVYMINDYGTDGVR